MHLVSENMNAYGLLNRRSLVIQGVNRVNVDNNSGKFWQW